MARIDPERIKDPQQYAHGKRLVRNAKLLGLTGLVAGASLIGAGIKDGRTANAVDKDPFKYIPEMSAIKQKSKILSAATDTVVAGQRAGENAILDKTDRMLQSEAKAHAAPDRVVVNERRRQFKAVDDSIVDELTESARIRDDLAQKCMGIKQAVVRKYQERGEREVNAGILINGLLGFAAMGTLMKGAGKIDEATYSDEELRRREQDEKIKALGLRGGAGKG